jgi:hypothetical protein
VVSEVIGCEKEYKEINEKQMKNNLEIDACFFIVSILNPTTYILFLINSCGD